MTIVLAPIAALTIALWTIAAVLTIVLIMDKLGSVLAAVPVVGGWLANHVRSMAQAITNACGHMLEGIDHLIGSAFSALSHFVGMLFDQFVAQSALIAHIAEIVAKGIYRVSGLKGIVHQLSKAVHVVLHRFVEIGRTLHRLGLRVHKLEREVAQGIGDDVLPRIKSLERKVSHVANDVIPAIESAEEALANDITALGEYIRANFLSTTTDAISAAVAIGLAALGLGGLRCNSLLGSLKRRGCGLWSGLEDLLGLFVDTVLLTHICDLLPPLESAVSEIAEPIVVGLTEVGAGLCSGGIGAPPRLQIPALSLPANPGVTLNLP